jgi:type VI secretion system protein ImpK
MRDDHDRRRGEGRRPTRDRDVDFEDDYDSEPPRRGRPSGRRREQKSGFFSRLFGGGTGRRQPRRRGFDWEGVDDEPSAGGPGEERGYYPEEDSRSTARREKPRSKRPRRKTLMDLCAPVFGYAAILPADSDEPQPEYEQVRGKIVGALHAIESEATEHDIDPEDAKQAGYALCLFIDGQVAESEWKGKAQWASEPLHIMLQQDPEGGINFFRRLDGFGERERAVKEVFLVCLALGYRGKYAELDPAQQAAKIGELRQKLVREMHPQPLDKRRELFPEAYRPAEGIEDELTPPPRWWLVASLSLVALAVLLYFVLFWVAGRSPRQAEQAIRQLADREVATAPALPEPADDAEEIDQ